MSLAGRVVLLTATEFDLFRGLSLKAGHVVTIPVLLRQVWGRRQAKSDAVSAMALEQVGAPMGDLSATQS